MHRRMRCINIIMECFKQLPEDSIQEKNTSVRCVCMSDTHSRTEEIKFNIPSGDIFIHAGDFTRHGLKREVEQFNKWIGDLPHQHKIVIAGNHEPSFDSNFEDIYYPNGCIFKAKMKTLLTNALYLEDSGTVVEGIKIYGTPWQPFHLGGGFNIPRGEALQKQWSLIPDDTDILVTHTPPAYHGDRVRSQANVGCVDLLNSVERRIKPKFHVFGHIHEGYGITSNGITTFINASTCDRHYRPVHKPIVFDFELPIPKYK